MILPLETTLSPFSASAKSGDTQGWDVWPHGLSGLGQRLDLELQCPPATAWVRDGAIVHPADTSPPIPKLQLEAGAGSLVLWSIFGSPGYILKFQTNLGHLPQI